MICLPVAGTGTEGSSRFTDTNTNSQINNNGDTMNISNAATEPWATLPQQRQQHQLVEQQRQQQKIQLVVANCNVSPPTVSAEADWKSTTSVSAMGCLKMPTSPKEEYDLKGAMMNDGIVKTAIKLSQDSDDAVENDESALECCGDDPTDDAVVVIPPPPPPPSQTANRTNKETSKTTTAAAQLAGKLTLINKNNNADDSTTGVVLQQVKHDATMSTDDQENMRTTTPPDEKDPSEGLLPTRLEVNKPSSTASLDENGGASSSLEVPDDPMLRHITTGPEKEDATKKDEAVQYLVSPITASSSISPGKRKKLAIPSIFEKNSSSSSSSISASPTKQGPDHSGETCRLASKTLSSPRKLIAIPSIFAKQLPGSSQQQPAVVTPAAQTTPVTKVLARNAAATPASRPYSSSPCWSNSSSNMPHVSPPGRERVAAVVVVPENNNNNNIVTPPPRWTGQTAPPNRVAASTNIMNQHCTMPFLPHVGDNDNIRSGNNTVAGTDKRQTITLLDPQRMEKKIERTKRRVAKLALASQIALLEERIEAAKRLQPAVADGKRGEASSSSSSRTSSEESSLVEEEMRMLSPEAASSSNSGCAAMILDECILSSIQPPAPGSANEPLCVVATHHDADPAVARTVAVGGETESRETGTGTGTINDDQCNESSATDAEPEPPSTDCGENCDRDGHPSRTAASEHDASIKADSCDECFESCAAPESAHIEYDALVAERLCVDENRHQDNHITPKTKGNHVGDNEAEASAEQQPADELEVGSVTSVNPTEGLTYDEAPTSICNGDQASGVEASSLREGSGAAVCSAEGKGFAVAANVAVHQPTDLATEMDPVQNESNKSNQSLVDEKAPKKKLRKLRSFFKKVKEKSRRRIFTASVA